MTVFLAAVVLVLIFAGFGYRLGAIRGVVSLAGIVTGGMMAFPLTPMVTPLFTSVGSRSPFWNWVLPPLSVFVLVQILFMIIGVVVHRKVEWHYKYKATDEMRHCWERLNSRLGVCVGVLAACGYLVLIGTIFYATGYLTYQLSAADSSKDDPKLVQLNRIRDDLHSTGLDRALAGVDPTPKAFYEAADLAGLLYHNPPLQSKLGDYPALLELAERPEFQELGRDPQFSEFMMSQPGLASIINHPKVQSIFASAEVLQAIYKLSPGDLLKFVRTGRSELFASEKILGRWLMEPQASFAAAYRRNPQMNSADSSKLRRQIDLLAGLSLIATPDKRLVLRGSTLNNAGSWQRSGANYSVNVVGPSISVGRAGGPFDEVVADERELQLRSSGDGFTLVFRKPE